MTRTYAALAASFAPERFAMVAGDPFVAVGKCGELVLADDIVDPCEGPISGALEYFPQYRIRRIGSIGPDHLSRRVETRTFIGLERAGDVVPRGETIRQRPGIEYRLSRAVGSARIHRVRG